jgi:hypothetical protein
MIDKYFKHDTKNKMTLFIGDKLEVFIPTRYDRYEGCLVVENTVATLAIFNMTINGKIKKLFYLPAVISMDYSDNELVLIDDKEYMKLTLRKGDRFMISSEVICNKSLGFILFYEFIQLGNYPDGITYDNIGSMLEPLTELTGLSFGADNAVVEALFSQLSRDGNDLGQLYRLTNMKKKEHIVPMRDIAHAARSTTGKLVGNYLDSTMDSAIVNPSTSSSEIENILRQ